MKQKRSLEDVSRALESAKCSGQAPAVTEKSAGVKVRRAIEKLEKIASR